MLSVKTQSPLKWKAWQLICKTHVRLFHSVASWWDKLSDEVQRQQKHLCWTKSEESHSDSKLTLSSWEEVMLPEHKLYKGNLFRFFLVTAQRKVIRCSRWVYKDTKTFTPSSPCPCHLLLRQLAWISHILYCSLPQEVFTFSIWV